MISAWSVTDTGTIRKQNEDAHRCLIWDDGATAAAVVCDGMGGARAGNVASHLAVEAFCEVLERERAACADNPGGTLIAAADVANQVVCFKADMDSMYSGMGTTMVAVLLFADGHAHILNVGDSRAYHVTGTGIRRITRDHSVVEDLIVQGEITPEEARQHPQRNLITRALGSERQVQADLYEERLAEGEVILLCTDGLSNVVTEQEILYELVYGGPIETCCQRLLDITISRGAPDNVTVVLFQV